MKWLIKLALDARVYGNGVKLEISNIESFNGHFRAECLDQHWIETLSEAQEVIEARKVE